MSWQAVRAVLRSPRRFGTGARMVLTVLAEYADEKGGAILVSVGTVAKESELKRRMVQTHMRTLQGTKEKPGILILEKEAQARHRYGTREWRIDLAALGAAEPEISAGTAPPETGDLLDTPATEQGVQPTAPLDDPAGVQSTTSRGAVSDTEGCNLRHQGVQPTAPNPPVESTRESTRESPLARVRARGGQDSIALAFASWNELAAAKGLAAATMPTPVYPQQDRVTALTARLAECGGIDGWHAALARVAASDRLRGAMSSGWRCTLDWLLKPDRFRSVVEGQWDNREPTGRGSKVEQEALEILERLERNET